MTHLSRAALVGLFLLPMAMVGSSSARADVTTVFDVSGTFGNSWTLTGTVTVDVTNGNATALDVTADAFDFTSISTQSSEGGEYLIGSVASSKSANLALFFPVASLVGYDGGSLSTDTRVVDTFTGHIEFLTTGSATVASTTAVPEPSTWAMALRGFAGRGLAGYPPSPRTPPFAS